MQNTQKKTKIPKNLLSLLMEQYNEEGEGPLIKKETKNPYRIILSEDKEYKEGEGPLTEEEREYLDRIILALYPTKNDIENENDIENKNKPIENVYNIFSETFPRKDISMIKPYIEKHFVKINLLLGYAFFAPSYRQPTSSRKKMKMTIKIVFSID